MSSPSGAKGTRHEREKTYDEHTIRPALQGYRMYVLYD